ncbi:MAG TPA: MFS transporter, partial [Gemmatimonadaceae bacterium]|nr:MFS transporter [Gemmatimonadaceae bacterium]
ADFGMHEDESAYPSPRRAWWAVAVLTLANVSAFVDRQILSLLVVPIRRDLGIGDEEMSYLMGLSFALFYTVLGIPLGRLADRRSRRAIVGWGIAVWSVMTTLSGLARGYGQLLLARVGVGVGEAALGPAAISLIADAFPRDRRGTAMGVYSIGTFLGSGLAYFVGGAVVGAVSAEATWHWPVVGALRPWQSVFLLIGPPGLLVALLFLTVAEPARRERLDSRASPALWAWVRANRRLFWSQSVGFALSATVNYGIAAWLATFLMRTHGWPVARAGMVQGTLTMTVGVLGVVAGGRLSDWFVRRGRTDGPLLVGMIGALGMLVSATAYPLVPSVTLVVALLVPVNLFAALPWGAASAAAAEVMPASLRAQGSALYFFLLSLISGVLGPTAVAVVTQRVFGGDAQLRYGLAVVSAVGMSLTLLLLAYARGPYRARVTSG